MWREKHIVSKINDGLCYWSFTGLLLTSRWMKNGFELDVKGIIWLFQNVTVVFLTCSDAKLREEDGN